MTKNKQLSKILFSMELMKCVACFCLLYIQEFGVTGKLYSYTHKK